MAVDFSRKNLPPGPLYLFGTDWLGRDMMKRTFPEYPFGLCDSGGGRFDRSGSRDSGGAHGSGSGRADFRAD